MAGSVTRRQGQSFLFVTPQQKIYYSGDSGMWLTKAIAIFGPVDLAIMENGQYDQDWNIST